MKDKIDEIITELRNANISKDKAINQILAFFKTEECIAATINDCPWGKDNVEFRQKWLDIHERYLADFVVERECDGIEHKYMDSPYSCCNSTGKITRPLTWKDVSHLLNNTINITIEGKDMGTYICMEFPDGGRGKKRGLR